jgi:DNA helicase-2/ATP-dependent DNA helicase PcrA
MPLSDNIVSERPSYLRDLNSAQLQAVLYGVDGSGCVPGPLLIIAGAGTGKTKTLAHRVAHLALAGTSLDRILLLTFTRRAAAEMTRRAQRILAQARADMPGKGAGTGELAWAGTFHAIGSRLLRMHAPAIGLSPDFTVLDRSDSADLMNLVRSDLGLAKKDVRFPKKDTCLSIYSHTVNARCTLEHTLETDFPWCVEFKDDLKRLFGAYVAAKQRSNVLDFDDLLQHWSHMMEEPALAAAVGGQFDHILVDEYQDTNAVQARILLGMKPDGRGLAVVGDDAQSIYSFRAATVRNILDFPKLFSPHAHVIKLEQNYRSTQPILDACNAVIGQAGEGYAKRLFSTKKSDERPQLVVAADEAAQVDYVVKRILEHREAGIDLKHQAVLFRASHHSAQLELELARRNIPFVKYGGLKFLETAHVKDLLGVLRWAENPRDEVAAFRVLQLLPGVGPGWARRAMTHLGNSAFDFAVLCAIAPPAAAASHWRELCDLLLKLRAKDTPWDGQVQLVRRWYQPHLERIHDHVTVRAGDLDQLEQIAGGYRSRGRFLTELTLDPPDASAAHADTPALDEDYLILSTIHSAKGQEWDAVYVLNVVDGCIPSDLATGDPEQIDEERRLLYVAMTRAKQHLHLVHPMRLFRTQQHRYGDTSMLTPRSRFIPDRLLSLFERRGHAGAVVQNLEHGQNAVRIDVGARSRNLWR